MGIRIEFNAEFESALNLWFSPLAGESINYRDRNFSNRDDHVSVFDRITFPDLREDTFLRCDYDPFHSILHFKNQSLHLLSDYNRPAVICWSTKDLVVDFKTTAEDRTIARTEEIFAIVHRNRKRDFQFSAQLSKGQSRFVHQKQFDEDRSEYARAELAAADALIIEASCRGVGSSDPVAWPSVRTPSEYLEKTNAAVEEALETGRVLLRRKPQWARLHETCRRHLLSARDASGALRAALNRIYYLIWVRDGSFVETAITASGWKHGSRLWKNFLLENPTRIDTPFNQGRAFLMLVNNLTKWEEDGLFFAVWATFEDWVHWEDAPSPDQIQCLNDAVKWLEKYCYSSEVGLFGRGYACESPFFGTRDFGFDNAVGKPATTPAPTSEDGNRVLLAYDLYINEIMFTTYCMLAALLPPGAAADSFLERARSLRNRMACWFEEEMPPYGKLMLENGQFQTAPPYGLDLTDYVWALTAPRIPSQPQRIPSIRRRLLTEVPEHAPEYFLCAYFGLIASIDPWDMDEAELEKAIEYAVHQSVDAGTKLAMPFAIKEKLDVIDGDRWHDVRPQSFSAGPYLALISALLLRKLPFGLSARPSGLAERIEAYAYRDKLIDVFNHCDRFLRQALVSVNGTPQPYSLQIPEAALSRSRNRIDIHEGTDGDHGPLLLSSSVRLLKVIESPATVAYEIETFGFNSLRFFQVGEREIRVASDSGTIPDMEIHHDSDTTVVNFWGRGTMLVEIGR
jgi:hypothetical protein